MEEGEAEENRGKEEVVDDVGLCWMEACCRALEVHAADSTVQVSPQHFISHIIY
jgi:hypothetical protein